MVPDEILCIFLLLLLDKGDSAEVQIRPAYGNRLEDTHPYCIGKYRGNGFGEDITMIKKGYR